MGGSLIERREHTPKRRFCEERLKRIASVEKIQRLNESAPGGGREEAKRGAYARREVNENNGEQYQSAGDSIKRVARE